MESTPESLRIGWIGTGVMGRSMCGHLLERGHPLTVFNRTREKAEDLIARGATWAGTPREVAAASDVVFTIVGFPEDVRATYFGDRGVLAGVQEGAVIVDMTTSQPSLAEEIANAAAAKGVGAVDAPVSGGDVGARNAALSIMVGGDDASVQKVMPLFEAMGKNIVRQGGPGRGQHAKMCNQIVIAGTMIGVCESLLYGKQAGLDLESMLQSITKGAAGCWTLDNLAPRVLQRNFDPGFYIEHFIKDMGVALEEARRMGLSMPGLALVHQIYLAAQAQGHGKLGTHGLMLALEQISGKSSGA
ncbi:MAG: NAD(P)-dependent oxidoreductase [Opitutales bacterium]